ncbi:MAG TPA: YggS family pyridoxal phosphate-dependent enzyme [Anaerolineales bacterium]|nr:YggS family pyridoxal phosphate-dependent enzyme [Anaerolineales bacterium]
MAEIIQQNFQRVLSHISTAASKVGRTIGDVKLVVVTKGQPLEKIIAVLAVGANRLGENYAEEAISKIQNIPAEFQPEWHMIGHIQSRKARNVCEKFDWVHSLDSLKLATRLNHFAHEFERKLPVLLEFNVGGESTKSGFLAQEQSKWPDFLLDIEAILELPSLQVCGLMVIPPFDPDPEAARPYFRQARLLREYLKKNIPSCEWYELSMGMSNDYEIAIQEGATIVRIGQAILGERK